MSQTGYDYSPKGQPAPVCEPGEFVFAATALDHGHIQGQCNGLLEAGGELRWVFDPDPSRIESFRKTFPQAKPVRSLEKLLEDPEVCLVAAAAIPSERGPLGIQVMRAGKHYFTDKTPFTELSQLADAKRAAEETGKKYMVYYSERLHVECAVFAGELIEQGVVGRVVQVLGLGPHRLSANVRPAWFFEKAKYGGILCDIGSHQIEQFLFYSGALDATVTYARIANFSHKEYPELEDFGDAALVADNGATSYFRVDWLTPSRLRTWGDGRTFILGTNGYIEMRKYIDVTRDTGGDQLFLVNDEGEKHFSLGGKVGFPFFGRLILDCLQGTETAMTQRHAFKAAELCLKAQAVAQRIE
jgi:predicted dehydrogenase